MWQIPDRFRAEVSAVPRPGRGSLPPRLAAVAACVPRDARLVADVGADHGLLARELLRLDSGRTVIAIDASEATLPTARAALAAPIEAGRAQVRQGDGLDGLWPTAPDALVLAGLGGRTVEDVVRRAWADGHRPRHIVVQPQFGHEEVRDTLLGGGYGVVSEALVVDRQRIYLTAAFGLGVGVRVLADDLDRYVGPLLRTPPFASLPLARAWCAARLDWLRERGVNAARTAAFEEFAANLAAAITPG